MMSRVRHILRCYELNMGIKEMSKVLGMSRNTVRKYLHQVQETGKDARELLSMTDAQLEAFFYEPQTTERRLDPRADTLNALLPGYAKLMQRHGTTRVEVYEQYISENPDGYKLTQFCVRLNQYMHYTKAIGHVEHVAGEHMYVDYAGDKLHIVNALTGEERPVEVFVAILPCSHYTYCEAVYTQQKEDFIKGCENALHFYGGVPRAIVPDNLKSAVTKPSKIEPIINEDFAMFADHYGCAVYPARAKRPQDKALVENAVKLMYKQVYPATTGRVYHSLEELNADLWVALKAFNDKTMYRRNYSRYEQFVRVEKDYLSALPEKRFYLKRRKTATVKRNSYVLLDKHNYSVPTEYIGKKVDLVYDNDTVEIYHNFRLVTAHRIDTTPFGFTEKEAHRLPGHRGGFGNVMEETYKRAALIDEVVVSYMKHIAEEKAYPAQAYKSCRGLLSLGEKYGNDQLVEACRMAEEERQYSYNAIEKLLRQRKDEPMSVIERGTAVAPTPEHGNIRGKEYFAEISNSNNRKK